MFPKRSLKSELFAKKNELQLYIEFLCICFYTFITFDFRRCYHVILRLVLKFSTLECSPTSNSQTKHSCVILMNRLKIGRSFRFPIQYTYNIICYRSHATHYFFIYICKKYCFRLNYDYKFNKTQITFTLTYIFLHTNNSCIIFLHMCEIKYQIKEITAYTIIVFYFNFFLFVIIQIV